MRTGDIAKQQNIDIAVKCLAVYFVMMPFDSFPVFGMGSLLKIVAFLPLLAIIIYHRARKIMINRLTIAFLIYVSTNIFTCIYSVAPALSMNEIRRLILNGMLIITVGGMYNRYSKEEFQYLVRALIIGGLATVAATLLFSDTSSTGRLTFALNGASQDQNYINGYMYFAFTWFLHKVIGEKKPVYAIPSVLLLIFTLMTGSRGATVALAVIAVMVVIYNMFNTGKVRISIIVITAIIAILLYNNLDFILSLLPSEVAERFSIDYISHYKGTNRNVLWRLLIDTYKNGNMFRKIFGYGYGTVSVVNTFNGLVAHNLFLDHLISGGIVGAAIFVYMHTVFAVEAWKLKEPVIFASYIGYMAMSMTLSLTNYKPLWNCMMMVMILKYAAGKDAPVVCRNVNYSHTYYKERTENSFLGGLLQKWQKIKCW